MRDSSTSPRAIGSTPALSSTSLAAAEDPTRPDSAERSILRRWAKAASITVNTCARVAVVSGAGRRRMATSPDSTLGTGQNTVGGTVPTREVSAYQAIFTDGMP
jgi:hypothetical protein